MTYHPKERPNSLSRRVFLQRSAGAAVALSGAGPLLAACGSTTTESSGTGEGPGGLPLARPDKRVTLPRWEDPIESGLEPETGGTFTVYNYPAYFYKKLLTEFGEKYDVEVQYTPFDRPSAGSYAERIAGNSPQKPARPGRPSEAIAQKPRIQPIFGADTRRPPSRDISRVWNECCTVPARKNSIPVMRPCATIPKIAALIPNDVRVEMPSITKPMCATEENAIRRFMSVCARHPSAP